MQRRLAMAGLAIASALVALSLGEVALRLSTGPRFPNTGSFSFRWMTYDPVLSWRNLPGHWDKTYYAAGKALPVRLAINALGLRGPEVEARKPAGVTRIVCLGDSATFGLINNPKPGQQKSRMVPTASYPGELARRLQAEAPGRFEVLNAGVIGYSSSHGLRQLAVRIVDLAPDVVTLRFGVNDSQASWAPWYRAHEPESRLLRATLYGLADWKLTRLTLGAYQAAHWLHPEPESVSWSSRERYRRNLGRILEIANARGIRVLLLDYPISPTAPEHLAALQATLSRFHRDAHDVSQRAGAAVLDSSGRFASHASDGEPLFDASDAIHPNPRGAAFLAQLIHERLDGLGWLAPEASGAPEVRE